MQRSLFCEIPSPSAAYKAIIDTFQLHFYDQSDDRESGMASMWFRYNVNGQYSVIIVALCTILHQKSTVCCCITCKLFPVSEVLIISITIMLFGCIFVALGFLLSPITSLLKQPEQMFSSIRRTKQANSGCY